MKVDTKVGIKLSPPIQKTALLQGYMLAQVKALLLGDNMIWQIFTFSVLTCSGTLPFLQSAAEG